jgi:hypothetical protein
MRKLLTLTVILSCAGLAWADGNGNIAVTTAPVPAGVQIIKPIHLTQNADLFFGHVVKGRNFSGGTISLFNGLSMTGDIFTRNNSQPAHTANFTVTGESGAPYVFGAGTLLNLTKQGGEPIDPTTIIGLQLLFDNNPNATIGNAGIGTITSSFNVGGLLTIPYNVGTGTYYGSFQVTVHYM